MIKLFKISTNRYDSVVGVTQLQVSIRAWHLSGKHHVERWKRANLSAHCQQVCTNSGVVEGTRRTAFPH